MQGNISSERIRLLGKASRDFPGCPHVSTLFRWALRGIKGTKLETVVCGGRRYTSLEAIGRFLAKLNRAPPAPGPPPPPRCQQKNSRVEEELTRLGI